MKKMRELKIWQFGLAFLAVLFLAAGCGQNGIDKIKKMELGKPAPNFVLQDADGKVWELSSLKGKVVFVNFWATWCKPCRDEMSSIVDLNNAMAGKPFQMLSIVFNDDLDMANSFAKRLGATFPVLGNPAEELTQAYMITGVPETFIIDPQGIMQHKFIGPYNWNSPEIKNMIMKLLNTPGKP